MIHNIYHLNYEKTFNEDEAYELVNLLMAVTVRAKNKINGLNSRLEYFKAEPDQADQIQNELNSEIQSWSEKMRRLGGLPLALYQVKIPANPGHFIWEFPSVELDYQSN